MGNNGNSGRLYFWGLQNHCNGDCSHEIKRRLRFGRKAMTNLDSILKSRDIILLTNIHRAKTMVFPAAMYKCESWTIKKAECQKNWCFWTVVLEKILESPLDCKKIKPINPKEGLILNLKLHYFGHLNWRTDSLDRTLMMGKIEGRRRRGQQRLR